MIRATVVSGAAALLLTQPSLAATTSLRITIWPKGREHAVRHTWTLRCDPAGGTLPHASDACRALQKLKHPFAPVPPTAACTQLFGGPQEAVVAGRFRGSIVHATFDRKNGCEVARWNRVRFLFR